MPAGATHATRPYDDVSDLGSNGGVVQAAIPPRSTGLGSMVKTVSVPTSSGEFTVGEVMGDPPAPSSSGGESAGQDNEEVGSNNVESTEFAIASESQLMAAAAEGGMESAFSDLKSIEGFEEPEFGAEGSLDEGEGALPDAGEAAPGGEEFFGALAALVPTLVSTVGPIVAKGIASKLKPKVKAKLQKIAPLVKPIAGVVAPKPSQNKDAILAMIAKLLSASESMPMNESAMNDGGLGSEAIEVLVADAVAAIESIVDRDDRVRITNTTDIPFRRLCALRITFPSGAVMRGTGFLIGPRAVATAGHCVFYKSQGGWAKQIEVIPGANGTAKPFGSAVSTMMRSVAGWVNGGDTASDYGCVVLPSGAFSGRNLGSFGFAAFTPAELLAQKAVISGYPGDKPFAELWGAGRLLTAVAPTTLRYNTATMGGQSGAPVYVMRNNTRYAVGIHNYGSSTGNTATRITQSVFQRLTAWSQL